MACPALLFVPPPVRVPVPVPVVDVARGTRCLDSRPIRRIDLSATLRTPGIQSQINLDESTLLIQNTVTLVCVRFSISSSSPIWHALSTLNVSATVADAPSVSTSVSESAGGFSVLSPRRTLSSPLQGLRDTLLIVQTMVPG
ncbi:hypothetical protein PENPOL_c011G02837 [Penicillium polonicum]|uniref:Uncharacterized protein n=1 Tax=Penicillium polonicum TaxID=60169 RepID=A0A1V6NE14_PENPO|nr:hypothetical protein PENPOL_c011G02837 [Penicillium polonicum]